MQTRPIYLVVALFLLSSHVALELFSPYYRRHVGRFREAAAGAVLRSKRGVGAGVPADPRRPTSGVYASTYLLQVIQQHMRLQQQQGGSPLFVGRGLVTYTSASAVVTGQGWKARAACMVFLAAPRFLLSTLGAGSTLQHQLVLLSLTGEDLPAVGLLADSEDPSAGFPTVCSSPPMQLGLGPQPLAHCTVYEAVPAAPREILRRRQRGLAAASKMLAIGDLDGAYRRGGGSSGSSGSGGSRGSNGDGGGNGSDGCSCPVFWALLPPAAAAAAAASRPQQCCSPGAGKSSSSSQEWGGLQQQQQPGAAGGLLLVPPHGGGGGRVLAQWTVLPDTSPAGVEALLRESGAAPQAFLGGGPPPRPSGLLVELLDEWLLFPRAALLQLVPSLGGGLRALLFLVAICYLSYQDLAWLVDAIAALSARFDRHHPFLDLSGLWGRLLLACGVTMTLMTMLAVHTALATALAYTTMSGVLLGVRGLSVLAGWLQGPLWRLSGACWARLAAYLHAGAGAGAIPAAAAGAAAAARVLASSWDSPHPHPAMQAALLALHELCQDLVALCAAWMVCESQCLASEWAWSRLARVANGAAAVLECVAGGLALLAAGAGWRVASARAWLQLQQRLQQQAAAAAAAAGAGGHHPHDHGGVQAQVVIHAQQAAMVDVGHTAEALRALADELDNLDGAGGLQVGAGGQMVLAHPRPPRPLRLGQHWPAPLAFDFDVDDVAEMGLDVPRGFVCSLTLDLMRQPALLLSSNIAVPSTYDREAISSWLVERRRDPKSRRPLAADAQLVPNFDLYRALDDWARDIRVLRARQQQQQQQQAQQAAAAAGAGAGEEGAAAAAAAAGGAVPRAPRPARQSSSTATVSSLLAAAARGTAAAAAAAGAAAAAAAGASGRRRSARRHGQQQQRQQGQQQGRRRAGGEDDDAEQAEEDGEEDDDAVDSHPGAGWRGAAAAAAAAGAAGAAAGPSEQQQQAAGRSRMRRRSQA